MTSGAGWDKLMILSPGEKREWRVVFPNQNCDTILYHNSVSLPCSFPVAQLVEHGARNAKIMGSIPRESKS